MHSMLVVDAIAEENLRKASLRALERKIESLSRKVEASLSASIRRFNPSRLGGPGAAGRQRDQARASESRNITSGLINQLRKEIARRGTQTQISNTCSPAA
ncbi:TPA: hypothetical protein ACKQHR_001578 [Pseudomonas aeruginosa]|nr:hypothetical protein [Pseudomonas aeruginosa]